MNKNHREVLTQVAATHRANLHRNLQRRLDAARSQGNQDLVRLLEAEASYLK
ncbi:MAG: hypothetical protein KME16_05575 [Scytolyngbya sp. HA4215-MV1]|jgi:hypothetical protein|nr:hypothetical protein [Scytolyngbya sp. HA4215-MV1]